MTGRSSGKWFSDESVLRVLKGDIGKLSTYRSYGAESIAINWICMSFVIVFMSLAADRMTDL
jgi:hypothetical protein